MWNAMEKIIHFGEFVRWNRVKTGKTTEAFGKEVGVTARRLIAIEAMSTPDIQATTRAALARVIGIDPESFDDAWRSTPVPVTHRKSGPTTDEARLFRIACDNASVTPAEGMRRLRTWLVMQPADVQRAALSKDGPFTQAVGHAQDPAESARARIGRRAASAENPPAPDSRTENKRH
jgi:transcriptional regulator with XRE-family HTH domain